MVLAQPSVLAATFSVLAAALIVAALARWGPGLGLGLGRRPSSLPPGEAGAVFLFEGEALVDATPAARRLLEGADRRLTDLKGALAVLARGFGADLPGRLAELPASGRLRLPTPAGVLVAERAEDTLRIALEEVGEAAAERLRQEAAADELETLRALAEDAPQLIWAVDAAGALVWANRAYLATADLANSSGQEAGDGPDDEPAGGGAWPAAPLLEAPRGLPEGEPDTRRLSLRLPGRAEPQWLDVTSVRRGARVVRFAQDAGDLVAAEAARAVFVQTLTKTFATLSTGLAIFDRSRRLQIFNPAFLDLTGLPVAFLMARPLVHTVLDRLREARVLPEPRDYSSWREQVAALEAAAVQGHYCETWTLPTGRTFRVTGRPHPDGAIAFLFEDISDEMTLTRRFRAELDTAQSVLDSLDDAVAVFGPTGALSLSNAAYGRLWGPAGGADGGGAERTLTGEAGRWCAAAAPSALRAQIEGELTGGGRPPPLEGALRLLDGRALAMRVAPLARGSTMASFRAAEAAPLLVAGGEGLGAGSGAEDEADDAEPGDLAGTRHADEAPAHRAARLTALT